MHPYGINIFMYFLIKCPDLKLLNSSVLYVTYIMLFHPFSTMNAFVPIHWNYMKTATNIFLKNFICCVPQKNKVIQVWNNMWVSQWWQTFHFLFLIKRAWFINRNRQVCPLQSRSEHDDIHQYISLLHLFPASGPFCGLRMNHPLTRHSGISLEPHKLFHQLSN